MKIVCAWCKRRLGEKEPFNDRRTTHVLCPVCKDEFFPATGKNNRYVSRWKDTLRVYRGGQSWLT